jgi:rhamnulokinase
MKQSSVYLAVDLGATSGRVMAGVWLADSQTLDLEVVNRFPTSTTKINGSLYWDILDIFNSIKKGLGEAARLYGDRIESIGVDSWGVDYALIDSCGAILGNPYHYRDSRTDGMQSEVQKHVSKEEIYSETGIQFLFFNTIYQLYSEVIGDVGAIRSARRILFIPDLISYWLSGSMHQERTIASTSQLLNPKTGVWSQVLLESLDLMPGLFMPVVEPGTIVGVAKPEIRKETKLGEVPIVAVPGHDTASAFVALPGNRSGYAIMSSGTWSLIGLELKQPLGREALVDGFSNEIGYDGTVRFLKNICGMWLIEECRRSWAELGREYEYDEIVAMAEASPRMQSLIDPDAPEFAAPEDMLVSIAAFCRRTGQATPESDAAMVRCIFDSLALKYRYVFRKLEAYSPEPLQGLYMLGGGARNRLLNQLTADVLGVSVVTGPAEATAIGSIAVQMISTGALENLSSARDVIGNSFASEVFEPSVNDQFDDAVIRFEKLLVS